MPSCEASGSNVGFSVCFVLWVYDCSSLSELFVIGVVVEGAIQTQTHTFSRYRWDEVSVLDLKGESRRKHNGVRKISC